MHHRKIIGPVAKSSTQAPSSAPPSQPRPLPPDLLRDASRRLGILALVAAALWVFGTIFYHWSLLVTDPATLSWMAPLQSDAFIVPGFIASIALYAYSRTTRRDPHFILDVGLGYMIFTSLLLGQMFHWDRVPDNFHIMPVLTWNGAITIIFAALVPSTPLRTLAAGLITVSMNPLAMYIARERGVWNFGPLSNIFVMHYPDYLLVSVAVVIAHVLTGLGQQVARAREMGSYELGELLGTGGMGEVYRAKHRLLARPAAIKLIRPEVLAARGESADVAIERFKREANIAAQLRSPNTVLLYDFGVTDEQTLYLVMELLEGMTLENLVRKTGPVSASRVVYLLRQVCASLEEAHASDLVHRDIKPANIHVGRVGLRNDVVKVLDFGLAKAITHDGSFNERETLAAMATQLTMEVGSGSATRDALVPGTPAYMAPELLRAEPIDGRSDLYALGCVGYYLLTGTLVFEAGTIVEMFAKHLSATPIAPSQRTEVPVPPALDALVLACLAKDPRERPQSAAALAAQLAAIRVEAWDETKAEAWWRDNG